MTDTSFWIQVYLYGLPGSGCNSIALRLVKNIYPPTCSIPESPLSWKLDDSMTVLFYFNLPDGRRKIGFDNIDPRFLQKSLAFFVIDLSNCFDEQKHISAYNRSFCKCQNVIFIGTKADLVEEGDPMDILKRDVYMIDPDYHGEMIVTSSLTKEGIDTIKKKELLNMEMR